MGEICDDMLEGRSCSTCGVWFTEEHGYPVVCKDCWKDMTLAERKYHQRAVHEDL